MSDRKGCGGCDTAKRHDPANQATNFEYNARSQNTAVVDALNQRYTFVYDSLGQVTQMTRASLSLSFVYDNNGNLKSKGDTSGQWDYLWDAENRLLEAHWPHDPAGGGGEGEIPGPPPLSYTVTYQYDALGRRIQQQFEQGGPAPNSTTTKLVHDGHDVIEDLGDSGAVQTRYLNGPGIDNKLRQTNVSTGASYYFLADHLGSTRALTDVSGNVVEQISYDSFGNSSGSALTRYGYTGRERDEITGQLYYRARFYDPQLGRFISEDPIGFGGGDVNLYGYVWQNPLGYRDPLGLDGWGNDLADWLDRQIERLHRRLTSDPDAVNFNTVVIYGSNVYHSYADLLRVGSGFGHAIFAPCEDNYGRAAAALQDVVRASAIFEILGGPAAGAAGSGTTAALAGRSGAALESGSAAANGVTSVRRGIWPGTANEMDELLGMGGRRIPDLPSVAGRDKVVWQTSDSVKITFEQHPYHPNAPAWHQDPHWHLDTPWIKHARYLPGDPFP
ncbi:MAG: RHS repeat domain-containing protein [Pyrinomonadaceae bacterium]